MQILKKTELKALEKARKIGSEEVIKILKEKNLGGRSGGNFPTGTKWEYALKSDGEKYVICNADEGEPGTFKDKYIIKNNPETLVEGILIAAETIKAKKAFIYLRGEYEYLRKDLQKVIDKVLKKAGSEVEIEIVLGEGSYVCGEETAIIESIEGFRGQPYYKPPFPTDEGLYGKPTVINNVETLTCAAQAILFDDWDSNLRLFSVSGNVSKPGTYELPLGIDLCKVLEMAEPKNKVKAIYFGCFGGCMPFCEIKLTHENICGKNCILGASTIIVVDEKQSIPDVGMTIAKFYEFESCGKCTPCREGSKRILDLYIKINSGFATKEDLDTLHDLAKHIHETSLCGLGQTSTNHTLTELEYFKKEFEDKVK